MAWRDRLIDLFPEVVIGNTHHVVSGDVCVIEEPDRGAVGAPPEDLLNPTILKEIEMLLLLRRGGLLADTYLYWHNASLMEHTEDGPKKDIKCHPGCYKDLSCGA